MQITADVLDAVRDAGRAGLTLAAITTRANITHARARHIIQNLAVAGLVYKNDKVAIITPNGISFLKCCRQMTDMAKSLGLKL